MSPTKREPYSQRCEMGALRSDSGMAINGNQSWASIGVVSPNSVRIVDRKVDKKKDRLFLRLETKKGFDVNVKIPLAGTTALLRLLFAPATDTATVQAASRKSVGRRVFIGPLAQSLSSWASPPP